MNATPIIALTGLAGAGKTTIANAVCAKLGFERMSFADPLREMLVLLGVDRVRMKEHKNTPIDWLGGKTPRELMQSLGTEWGRDMVCPELWVNATIQRIYSQMIRSDIMFNGVVIDDLRFNNEAKAIRSSHGMVARINRPGLAQMTHASESGVDPEFVDLIYINDNPGSLEEIVDDICFRARAGQAG